MKKSEFNIYMYLFYFRVIFAFLGLSSHRNVQKIKGYRYFPGIPRTRDFCGIAGIGILLVSRSLSRGFGIFSLSDILILGIENFLISQDFLYWISFLDSWIPLDSKSFFWDFRDFPKKKHFWSKLKNNRLYGFIKSENLIAMLSRAISGLHPLHVQRRKKWWSENPPRPHGNFVSK